MGCYNQKQIYTASDQALFGLRLDTAPHCAVPFFMKQWGIAMNYKQMFLMCALALSG